MTHSQKVLWHEGMLLLPQHFQQSDRHTAAGLRSVLAQAQAYAYGVSRLTIDGEALGNQQLKVTDAAGILPDGLTFDIPAADAAPLARPITLPAGRERLTVYLAAALERPGEVNSSDSGALDGRATRFRTSTTTLADDSGGERQDVQLAARHLLVVFDGESLDGLSVLPIAEIVRTGNGSLALSDHFVPACLAVAAAPVLGQQLKRTLEILASRSGEIALSRRQRTQGKVEFTVSESANFLMLHTLNGFLPVLTHCAGRPRLHPETLFVELTRLAGELSTFSAEGTARNLPVYDHDHLATCFAALDERLRALLETSITLRYVPIALTKSSERIHAARLPEAVFEGHRLYLSVQCGLPTERVMKELPIKAKIASTGRLPGLIAQAMRGLPLTYLSVPPGEIPAQPGCSYFELSREGEHWQGATETRTLSLFLPPEFTDPKLELMAVKE